MFQICKNIFLMAMIFEQNKKCMDSGSVFEFNWFWTHYNNWFRNSVNASYKRDTNFVR